MPRDEAIASLLKGFAFHRKHEGDSWLPRDAWDPEAWDIDSLYLYIVTDGSVGGPKAKAQRTPRPEIAGMKNCDVCDPGLSRDDAARAALVKQLSQAISSGGPATVAAASTLWQQLLVEIGLGHLQTQLEGFELAEAAAEVAAGRPAFLSRLKAAGVEKLADRQKIANAVARASREGRAGAASR